MKNGIYYVFKQANSPLEEASKPIRELSTGEILVSIDYATICGSDLHTFCGIRQEPTPSIIGHEIVGQITQLEQSDQLADATGKPLSIGDRITWTVYASDPSTASYSRDVPQKNQDLYKYGHRRLSDEDQFNGGLATHIILRPHTCVRILPDELPLPIAATINCAIATAAGALRLLGDVRGRTIVISGMGLLGLAFVSMCKEAAAENIIVSDVNPDRLKLAKKFGADHIINSQELALSTYLETHAMVPDRYVDMSGAPQAMEHGIAALGLNGIAVLIGAVFKQRKIELDAENMIRKLITIRGLHNYNYEDFNFAVDFIVRNWKIYPFEDLIEREFAFSNINEAFAYAINNKPIRAGVKVSFN